MRFEFGSEMMYIFPIMKKDILNIC